MSLDNQVGNNTNPSFLERIVNSRRAITRTLAGPIVALSLLLTPYALADEKRLPKPPASIKMNTDYSSDSPMKPFYDSLGKKLEERLKHVIDSVVNSLNIDTSIYDQFLQEIRKGKQETSYHGRTLKHVSGIGDGFVITDAKLPEGKKPFNASDAYLRIASVIADAYFGPITREDGNISAKKFYDGELKTILDEWGKANKNVRKYTSGIDGKPALTAWDNFVDLLAIALAETNPEVTYRHGKNEPRIRLDADYNPSTPTIALYSRDDWSIEGAKLTPAQKFLKYVAGNVDSELWGDFYKDKFSSATHGLEVIIGRVKGVLAENTDLRNRFTTAITNFYIQDMPSIMKEQGDSLIGIYTSSKEFKTWQEQITKQIQQQASEGLFSQDHVNTKVNDAVDAEKKAFVESAGLYAGAVGKYFTEFKLPEVSGTTTAPNPMDYDALIFLREIKFPDGIRKDHRGTLDNIFTKSVDEYIASLGKLIAEQQFELGKAQGKTEGRQKANEEYEQNHIYTVPTLVAGKNSNRTIFIGARLVWSRQEEPAARFGIEIAKYLRGKTETIEGKATSTVGKFGDVFMQRVDTEKTPEGYARLFVGKNVRPRLYAEGDVGAEFLSTRDLDYSRLVGKGLGLPNLNGTPTGEEGTDIIPFAGLHLFGTARKGPVYLQLGGQGSVGYDNGIFARGGPEARFGVDYKHFVLDGRFSQNYQKGEKTNTKIGISAGGRF